MLGLPMISTQLAQMAINVTNTLVLGRLGPEALAASVLGWQLFFVVWIFGNGFCFAVMPLVASSLGSHDPRGIARYARMGLWLCLAYAMLTVLPLWHSEQIFLALGQEPAIAALASDYVRLLQWSLFAQLGTILLRSVFGALHRPGIVMWALMGGALLNLGLNLVLVFGFAGLPAMGIRGAGLATVVATGAVAAFLFAYAHYPPQMRALGLFSRPWRADWPALQEIFRLGWPIGTTIVAEVGLFSATSIMMGWVGAQALAAHGIVLQLSGLSFMVPLGLSAAATIRVGWAHGQRDHAAALRASRAALLLGLCTSGVAALTFLSFPQFLIGLYLDLADPQTEDVLSFARAFLMVSASFQLVDGLQALANGALRGLKDTRVPMLLALVSYWLLGMPLGYWLTFHLGVGGTGIWWGLALGLACASVSLSLRLRHQLRQLARTPRWR